MVMKYEKYIREDGMVAVLYSPGYGAGWYSWSCNNEQGLLFDKEIVQAVLDKDVEKARQIASDKYPDEYVSDQDLAIEWVAPGDTFEIEGYHGHESVHIIGPRPYLIA